MLGKGEDTPASVRVRRRSMDRYIKSVEALGGHGRLTDGPSEP
jgi:hypothetical protein